MKFIYKKSFLIFLNVLISIALAILIFINIQESRRSRAAEKLVQHTYEVITNAEKLLRLSTQEVMASRGYIITGKEAYLDPLLDSRNEIHEVVDELKTLTRDNPTQQKRLDTIGQLVNNRIKFTDSINRIRRNNLQAAIETTNSNYGKILMDSLRSGLQQFSLTEYDLLHQRQDQFGEVKRKEEIAKGILILLIITFAGFVVLLLLRYINVQQKLYNEASKKSAILEQLSEPIVLTDKDFRIVEWNKSCEKLYGWKEEEVLGKRIGDVLQIRSTEKYQSSFDQLIKFGFWNGEFTHFTKQGKQLSVLVSITLIKNNTGELTGAVCLFQNISQRKELEQSLKETNQSLEDMLSVQLLETQSANEKLREINTNIQSAREEERKRISRELHDDLGQMLTSAKLYLSFIGEELNIQEPDLRNNFKEVLNTLDYCIKTVRNIAMELRPHALEDLGFLEAIQVHAKRFEKEIGIPVFLQNDVPELQLDKQTAFELFRVFQEAMNNIAKHAKATQVKILISKEDSRLIILIEDNGVGFHMGELKQQSLGLVNMKERTALVNAGFDVHSSPGKGTEVKISLSL